MKLIIQRVSEASVTIDSKDIAKINKGLLVLMGIGNNDNEEQINWMVNKLINLRIFNDFEGKMNLSIKDIGGSFLIIPNFTLYADSNKGYRPSFIKAAKPEISEPIFNKFVKELKAISNLEVQTGVFGADMKVALINDGPVTIEIEK